MEPQDTSAYYYLLTRDLGLIKARAQGIRTPKSKLKGALQEYSLATVAFVRAKAGWKITTAIPERNFFLDVRKEFNADPKRVEDITRQARKIMAHINETLMRFIVGEEKSEKIFNVVEKGFNALVKEGSRDDLIESLILFRVLFLLGYIDVQGFNFSIEDISDYQESVLSLVDKNKSSMIRLINKGFKESQL
jgi:recombinational DNA repair protein (RecF pathway)